MFIFLSICYHSVYHLIINNYVYKKLRDFDLYIKVEVEREEMGGIHDFFFLFISLVPKIIQISCFQY